VSSMYCQCGSGSGQRGFHRRIDRAGRKSSSQEEGEKSDSKKKE